MQVYVTQKSCQKYVRLKFYSPRSAKELQLVEEGKRQFFNSMQGMKIFIADMVK